MNDLRDLHTHLALLSARGKRLMILKPETEFSVVVLDSSEADPLVVHRPKYSAATITEAVRLARIAVEEGKA